MALLLATEKATGKSQAKLWAPESQGSVVFSLKNKWSDIFISQQEGYDYKKQTSIQTHAFKTFSFNKEL